MYYLAIDLIAWAVTLAAFCLAWPLLKRRRIYVVVAVVLCLTPGFAYYPIVGWERAWPLVLCLPYYFMGLNYLPTAWLATAMPIGVMTWLFLGRLNLGTSKPSDEA